jgi:hypothetical protein
MRWILRIIIDQSLHRNGQFRLGRLLEIVANIVHDLTGQSYLQRQIEQDHKINQRPQPGSGSAGGLFQDDELGRPDFAFISRQGNRLALA